jgi:hypothetical protein
MHCPFAPSGSGRQKRKTQTDSTRGSRGNKRIVDILQFFDRHTPAIVTNHNFQLIRFAVFVNLDPDAIPSGGNPVFNNI